jgi:hypothetical protein
MFLIKEKTEPLAGFDTWFEHELLSKLIFLKRSRNLCHYPVEVDL